MWCSWSLRRLPAALTAAVVVAAGSPALAAPPSGEVDERTVQAQELFEQGQKLAESDPKRGLSALRASYELRPDYRVLYAIARACTRLNDPGCAASSYEQYLRDGAAEVSPARKKEVEAALKALTKNLGWLAIKSSTTGAFVKVDGVVVGRIPLAQPAAVAPGAHKVVLVAGGTVVERTVQVEKGATETVDVDMKKDDAAPAPPVTPAPAPEPETAAAPPPTESPPPPAPKKKGVPVVPWVLAGALAAGTGVSAYFTIQAQSDYDALRGRYPISRADLDEAHTTGKSLLILTAGLGAATAVMLGFAGFKTLSRSKDQAPEKVGFFVGPTGVALVGGFR